ncbi:Vacuolar protein sorting-associated protein 52 [Lithohypha guttulata]|nr:Vacuolar protein sorting-associated protein 52 [Lithohypha guttulata]
MWLDRFSNASTSNSSTPSRYRSPGPRQPSQLAQPQGNGLGIGVGRTNSSTSLDLGFSPNSSNVFLPLLQRQLTASNLRQEHKPPPEDVIDPVDVLQHILGPARRHQGSEAQGGHGSEPEAEIEFNGLSLQDYIGQDGEEITPKVVTPAARPKVERKVLEDFQTSVFAVDALLNSVESYLSDFKAELGQVSAEIESLQARSIHLNAQLDNRRKVEQLLGPAVEDISLSPRTIRAISEGLIDDTFAKALTEIEARQLNVDEKIKSRGQTKAAEDIKPLLEDLKSKAVERIRDYLVTQIKSLRSPNINAQVIQQQSFLKYKELYPFLARANSQLASDIGQAYVNTMKWYYSSNFARYNAALEKMPLHNIDQNDLLASEPTPRKQNVLGSSKGSQPQYDAFNLGRRADYLKFKDDRALPSHLAEDGKTTSYIEVPFRNFNQVLLDNLSAEYSAVTELFSTSSYHQVARRVAEIFEPTFTLGNHLTKRLIETTTDCLGILICIRLNQQYAFEAQRRKVPVMDDYVNYTNILLWPRFQKAMDMHVDSLKKAPTSANRGAAAAFSLVGGAASTSNTVAPHPITQRFGQFLHGLLTLSPTTGDDEPLAHSLTRLRTEYEALMGKLAKGAGDASKRNRFLFNNYTLVMTIISDTQGKLAEEQNEYFSNLVRDFKTR